MGFVKKSYFSMKNNFMEKSIQEKSGLVWLLYGAVVCSFSFWVDNLCRVLKTVYVTMHSRLGLCVQL